MMANHDKKSIRNLKFIQAMAVHGHGGWCGWGVALEDYLVIVDDDSVEVYNWLAVLQGLPILTTGRGDISLFVPEQQPTPIQYQVFLPAIIR